MAGHRTHDIVLLSDVAPATLGFAATTQHGIGMDAASGAPTAAAAAETHFASGSLSAFAAEATSERIAFAGGARDFSGSLHADSRSHSAGSAGFAGGFGTGGHGAWGGVSGHAPAGQGTGKKAASAPKAPKAKGNGGSGHGSSGGSAGASGVAPVAGFAANGMFTGSALGGDTLSALADSPSSPSPTPEPMSLLLLGAGLGAVYQARRYIR
ncbi:MAG TPA: PEP-CTERM sorting domain-containing protein [Vicinamibacterales bacterium]|nr:PEP-CTERM sorting domain-containing protein [Vicinamibacterales bacterium]